MTSLRAGALALALLQTAVVMGGQSPPAVRPLVVETTDGARLVGTDSGAGSRALVLLHGGPGLGMAYLEPDLQPLLKPDRRVVAFDQRGAARSTVPIDAAHLELADYVADVEAVRAKLGLSAIDLIGHSWGAMVAVAYARAHPQAVRRVVLVDPVPPRRDPHLDAFGSNLRAWMDPATRDEVKKLSLQRKDAADPVASCRAFWQIFIRGYFADPRDATAPSRMRGDVCAVPPESLRPDRDVNELTLDGLGSWDLRKDVSSVRAPVLVIHGRLDPLPLAGAEEWVASLPDARLLVIERSGHFPHVEKSDLFFAAVEGFLAGGWPPGAVRPRRNTRSD